MKTAISSARVLGLRPAGLLAEDIVVLYPFLQQPSWLNNQDFSCVHHFIMSIYTQWLESCGFKPTLKRRWAGSNPADSSPRSPLFEEILEISFRVHHAKWCRRRENSSKCPLRGQVQAENTDVHQMTWCRFF